MQNGKPIQDAEKVRIKRLKISLMHILQSSQQSRQPCDIELCIIISKPDLDSTRYDALEQGWLIGLQRTVNHLIAQF